jgi:hypothetical protein
MKYLRRIPEIHKINNPQFYFSSIKKYFTLPNLTEWEKDENSNIIIESIIEVYYELARSKRMERELVVCVDFYAAIIKQILKD